MSNTALAKASELEQSITPMQLIQSAIMQGAGIDTIERLAKLQRELVEYDARIAWNESMQRCQKAMKRIGVDAVNPQTKSKYASYGKLDAALRPIYGEEGFSLSFNTIDSPQPDCVRVLCEVSKSGYSKTYQIDMPADGKGAKGGDVMTKTHATGAAMSYGMRYLLKLIFNVAVGETDDDGNIGSLGDEQFIGYAEEIENASDLQELQQLFATAYKAAQAAKDQSGMKQLIAIKDKRKAELQ